MAVNMTNKNPFWCITVYGLTNPSRFFKNLCLYYCPNLLIGPFLRLLRIVPFGKHLSEKEFKTLFKKDLAIVKFREYGQKPPAFFMAIAEKHSR